MSILPEEAYPFFGHFQTLGDCLFQIVNGLELADFELKLAASGRRHRQRNDWQRQFGRRRRACSRRTMAAEASCGTCTDRRIGIIHDLMRTAATVARAVAAATAFTVGRILSTMTTLGRVVVGFISRLHFGFPFLFCLLSAAQSGEILSDGRCWTTPRAQKWRWNSVWGLASFPWGREIRAQTQRAHTHTRRSTLEKPEKSKQKSSKCDSKFSFTKARK